MDVNAQRAPAPLDLVSLGRDAWQLFVRQPAAHIGAFAIVLLLGTITAGLLTPALLAGYIRVVDRARRDEPVHATHVFDGLALLAPTLLVGLIYVVAVALGSLLILLPGVVIAVGWCYALWFVALEGHQTGAALRAAWALARQQTGSLLLLLVAVVAANLVGGLFVVGALLSGPLALIALTLAFDQLKGR